MCIQTDSEKTKKGIVWRDRNSPNDCCHYTALDRMVCRSANTCAGTAARRSAGETKPAVLSAQLIHVTVQDYAQTPFVKMVPDSGIQVSGLFTGAGESASAFIGLDEGTAGQKFRDIVIKAAADAKK